MDLSDFDKITTLGVTPSTDISKSNPALNYIEETVKHIEKNRHNVENLISKLGKFDSKFINKESSTVHNSETLECSYYLVTPAVLVEKTGNANKGMFTGPHIDYGVDIELQRAKYKDDTNIFKMWVKGEIQGSVVVTGDAGFVRNRLTNETFHGCSYPWIKSEADWKKFIKDL
jgi:hypothetical protein